MKVYDLTQKIERQHYYIVTYDSSTKTWYHDIESEEGFFPYGTIYNESYDHWESDYRGDGEYIAGTDELAKQFTDAMQVLNSARMTEQQQSWIEAKANLLHDPINWLTYTLGQHLTQRQIDEVIAELTDAVSE